MTTFILNNEDISTDQPTGSTVLDFVRYHKNLKGTKIGCREGDCGACTILVGELVDGKVRYRSMTSCLMPLANAAGKHIVTVEGVNNDDGTLTPVQQAMVDESPAKSASAESSYRRAGTDWAPIGNGTEARAGAAATSST